MKQTQLCGNHTTYLAKEKSEADERTGTMSIAKGDQLTLLAVAPGGVPVLRSYSERGRRTAPRVTGDTGGASGKVRRRESEEGAKHRG